jgi:hypothetical protein
MTYRKLSLPDDLPDAVRGAVDAGAEPFLRDVHTMLRLPMPAAGLDAGCGFSILNTLLSVVSGASVLLYSPHGGSGSLFKRFLVDYYPWASEPSRDGLCVGEEAAEELYDEFRNPFAHALGISVKEQKGEKGQKMRALVPRSYLLKVTRMAGAGEPAQSNGISEAITEHLESVGARPIWLQPTLIKQPHKIVVNAEALYWGTRKAIEAICRDPARTAAAAEFLNDASTNDASTRV